MRLIAFAFLIAVCALAPASADDLTPCAGLLGGPTGDAAQCDPSPAALASADGRPATLHVSRPVSAPRSAPGEPITLSADFLAGGLSGGVGAGACCCTWDRDRVVVVRDRHRARDRRHRRARR